MSCVSQPVSVFCLVTMEKELLRERPRHPEAGFLKSLLQLPGLFVLCSGKWSWHLCVRKLQRINNSVWNPSIDLTPLSIRQDALTLAVALFFSPLYLWVWGQAKTAPEVTLCYCLFIRSHGVTRKHKASSICTAQVQPPYVCSLLLKQKKLF